MGLAASALLAALCALPAAPALAQAAAQSKAKAAPHDAAPRKAAAAKPPAKGVKKAAPARSANPPRKAVAGNGLRVGPRTTRTLAVAPARPSFGQVYGLHATDDALDLKSSVALVVDQHTGEVLFSKNPQAVLPIASITKLMTALVVTEANLPMDERLTVTQDDVDSTAGSKSRLRLGTTLTRGEMLHLSLMSSENRAAHVLGRTYPGGLQRFVQLMNAKASDLGMAHTRYVEPTGLSSDNQATANDLSLLVSAAMAHPIIRQLSTSLDAVMPVGARGMQFHTTNGLVRNPEWDIGLQKTGYISAAGRCLVMQAQVAGRSLIMVLLDSAGKYSRIGDAERIRKWLITSAAPLVPGADAVVQPR
jgi:serine-type D-Ala-D-Ala endopeptidase (penicillin-binding protein 7)